MGCKPLATQHDGKRQEIFNFDDFEPTLAMPQLIDLKFLGLQEAIGAYLVETSEGPVLIETGPHSTYEHLKRGLNTHGYRAKDIKHVLLTHIHLDHAGAAWAFADQGANIYVHPFGKKHLSDPSVLMDSARRIYQDKMDELWGDMKPIKPEQIITPEHEEEVVVGNKSFKALFTPGHAKHHIAWQLEDTIFCGDIAGVKIGGGPVVPPCPPPDINIEDWLDSIKLIEEAGAKSIYLTHFGEITEIDWHLNELRTVLRDWANWIKGRWEMLQPTDEITRDFTQYTADQLRKQGVNELGVKQYEAANPSWMSVAGLIRYWKKRSENR